MKNVYNIFSLLTWTHSVSSAIHWYTCTSYKWRSITCQKCNCLCNLLGISWSAQCVGRFTVFQKLKLQYETEIKHSFVCALYYFSISFFVETTTFVQLGYCNAGAKLFTISSTYSTVIPYHTCIRGREKLTEFFITPLHLNDPKTHINEWYHCFFKKFKIFSQKISKKFTPYPFPRSSLPRISNCHMYSMMSTVKNYTHLTELTRTWYGANSKATHLVNWSTAALDMLYANIPGNCTTNEIFWASLKKIKKRKLN